MAVQIMGVQSVSDKVTQIYGLIDPLTTQLRYIGKTVYAPARRLRGHIAEARREGSKRRISAWINGLIVRGLLPEIVSIESVPAGVDWAEVEQFWIAYFRGIGARLCNLTDGGPGHVGFRQSSEMVPRRSRVGSKNPSFGKPMPAHVRDALRRGNERLRADPVRRHAAHQAQIAAMTPLALAKSIAGLKKSLVDPAARARRSIKIKAARNRPEDKERVSRQSKALWTEKREMIIARQMAGRGDGWKKKQSAAQKRRWAEPGSKARAAMALRRRLTDDDIDQIRLMAAAGLRFGDIARRYEVSQSTISNVVSGRRRKTQQDVALEAIGGYDYKLKQNSDNIL